MATFFTTDTHFGDSHILRQRGHAFSSLAEHDTVLVARWNEVVSPNYEVWHLGDFAAGASVVLCSRRRSRFPLTRFVFYMNL